MFNLFKKKPADISEPVFTLIKDFKSDKWYLHSVTRTSYTHYIVSNDRVNLSIVEYRTEEPKIRGLDWLTNDERALINKELLSLLIQIKKNNNQRGRDKFAKELGC